MMTISEIAKVCHEANRAYCEALGDTSQAAWAFAPTWQRESAEMGVNFRINNPTATPADMHESWSKQKIAEGWTHGAEKNAAKKTHPCLVPYKDLPIEQQRKDALFSAIVQALTS